MLVFSQTETQLLSKLWQMELLATQQSFLIVSSLLIEF